ncbi:MAG: hypothetical protein MZV65_00830 [Chromatiales bacterium]|nr:hypothetical protein [Chromatiales bacterium]
MFTHQDAGVSGRSGADPLGRRAAGDGSLDHRHRDRRIRAQGRQLRAGQPRSWCSASRPPRTWLSSTRSFPRWKSKSNINLQSMPALDDQEDPNFSDADYQLAAHAAALRVLTQYQGIEDSLDVAYELSRRTEAQRGVAHRAHHRGRGQDRQQLPRPRRPRCPTVEAPLARREALPQVFGGGSPRRLTAAACSRNSPGASACATINTMLQSGKANQTRSCKTATEFGRRDWGTEGFGSFAAAPCLVCRLPDRRPGWTPRSASHLPQDRASRLLGAARNHDRDARLPRQVADPALDERRGSRPVVGGNGRE